MVLPFARGRSRANDAPPTWVFAVLLIVPRENACPHEGRRGHTGATRGNRASRQVRKALLASTRHPTSLRTAGEASTREQAAPLSRKLFGCGTRAQDCSGSKGRDYSKPEMASFQAHSDTCAGLMGRIFCTQPAGIMTEIVINQRMADVF